MSPGRPPIETAYEKIAALRQTARALRRVDPRPPWEREWQLLEFAQKQIDDAAKPSELTPIIIAIRWPPGMGTLKIRADIVERAAHAADWVEDTAGRLEQPWRQEVARVFETPRVHDRIAAACADQYRDQHYAPAVLRACLALEMMLRERSGRRDLDGTSLVEHLFSVGNGELMFNALEDESDRNEQVGLMEIFRGAVRALRNPRAHKLVNDSRESALDSILLLSVLARRLESARSRASAPATS